MIFLYIALTVIFLVSALLLFFKHKYQYWKRKNITFLPPSIPFGNIQNSYNKTMSFGEQLKHFYMKFKQSGKPYGGIYLMSNAVYMPIKPEHIKEVLTKDFSHFMDRGIYVNTKTDPLSGHLVSLGGDRWKNLRTKLTPTFTSSKLKNMYGNLLECTKTLEDLIEHEISMRRPLDIKEITGKYTTAVIGSCAFGLELNTIRDDNCPFREHGKRIFQRSKLRALRSTLAMNFPKLAHALGVRLIPQDTADFFIDVVRQTVEYREKNSYHREDFMQLLIDLKNKNESDGGINLTIEEIAAQCFVFFLAGFETSSITLTFLLYELALNQDIQEAVRSEINEVVTNEGSMTYDGLIEMKYMSQVIDETMRKYPAIPFLSRKCIKDYKVPETDLTIEEGTRCLISVLGLHYDDEYYPEPEVFDPERFSEENRCNRHQYTFLPFGDGPRSCIGSRFGLLETKVALAELLRKYRFTLNPMTQCPLQFSPHANVITPKYGVWLNAEKL